MIYTELQKTVIQVSLLSLILLSLGALILMARNKIKEYRDLVNWRKGLRRHQFIRVKDYDELIRVWNNHGDYITIKDGNHYPKILITNVYPFKEKQIWELV